MDNRYHNLEKHYDEDYARYLFRDHRPKYQAHLSYIEALVKKIIDLTRVH